MSIPPGNELFSMYLSNIAAYFSWLVDQQSNPTLYVTNSIIVYDHYRPAISYKMLQAVISSSQNVRKHVFPKGHMMLQNNKNHIGSF